ncbi:MAG: ATP-grasp domain-containing protein, partial [Bacteroidia bacterium]
RDGFPPIVVSEYLPGQEYTVDCLIQNGEIKFIIPRTREKMNNGISVAGTIEKNDDIIKYCRKILNSLSLDGPIGIQVKYSKNNQPLLVEINPRIQGTTVACTGAGVNISLIAVLPEKYNNVTQDSVKWNTKFIRHYNELYY